MAVTETVEPPVVGVNANNLEGQSRYYVVIITSSRWGTVQAWLPDTVMMAAKSSWGPIVGNFDTALGNWIGSGALSGTSGTTAFQRKLTAQAWRGVEPLQLTLQLHFFATEDASREVVEPIKRLLQISLPTRVNPDVEFSWLLPPGPVPVGLKTINIPGVGEIKLPGEGVGGTGRSSQDVINVYLGNFLALKEVFIADIPVVEFSAKLSKDGLPMEGKCYVVFRTVYSPTAQDMDIYLGSILGTPTTGGRPDLK